MAKRLTFYTLLAFVGPVSIVLASSHTGALIGMQAGYLSMESKIKRDLVGISRSDKSSISDHSATFGLFLGYGAQLAEHKLYLGGEIHANLQGAEAKRSDRTVFASNLQSQLRMRESYGLAGKVGYVFNDVLAYLKLGAVSTRFEVRSTNLSFTPASQAKARTRKVGGLVGVGADFPISKNLAIGGEYVFAVYGPVKLTHPNVATYRYKPRTNTFQVRLRWLFGGE